MRKFTLLALLLIVTMLLSSCGVSGPKELQFDIQTAADSTGLFQERKEFGEVPEEYKTYDLYLPDVTQESGTDMAISSRVASADGSKLYYTVYETDGHPAPTGYYAYVFCYDVAANKSEIIDSAKGYSNYRIVFAGEKTLLWEVYREDKNNSTFIESYDLETKEITVLAEIPEMGGGVKCLAGDEDFLVYAIYPDRYALKAFARDTMEEIPLPEEMQTHWYAYHEGELASFACDAEENTLTLTIFDLKSQKMVETVQIANHIDFVADFLMNDRYILWTTMRGAEEVTCIYDREAGELSYLNIRTFGAIIAQWNPQKSMLYCKEGAPSYKGYFAFDLAEKTYAYYNPDPQGNPSGTQQKDQTGKDTQAGSGITIPYRTAAELYDPSYIYTGGKSGVNGARVYSLEDTPNKIQEELVARRSYYVVMKQFDELEKLYGASAVWSVSEKENTDNTARYSYTIHDLAIVDASAIEGYFAQIVGEALAHHDLNQFTIVQCDATELWDETVFWGSQFPPKRYKNFWIVGTTEEDPEWKLYERIHGNFYPDPVKTEFEPWESK